MKLSIIIPVYNVEAYLARCLDSVIDPACTDYEIIPVNDGSTDGSGAILDEYARQYPALIKPVTTPNGGLGHARNTGLALARGEYILFLDSDDRLTDGALSEMLTVLNGSFDIGIFDFAAIDEQGRQLSLSRGCGREGSFCFSDYPALLMDPPNAVNKLWKRQLFLDHGILFPDRVWFEDLATIPKLYLHAGSIRYFPKLWYLYLQRSGSITRSADAGRNREMLGAVDSVLRHYREQGAYEEYRDELCWLCLYHELLTSSTRVALIDPNSPVLDELLDDFRRRFPDWRENPYVLTMSRKYRLLVALITARFRKTLRLIMQANNLLKGK